MISLEKFDVSLNPVVNLPSPWGHYLSDTMRMIYGQNTPSFCGVEVENDLADNEIFFIYIWYIVIFSFFDDFR